MKMISFCNKKGGVGKTTLCKNIAYKLALEDKKILLIDLDPQANLTMDFAQENIKFKNSLMDIITTKNNIENIEINKIIKVSKYKNIDLISAQKELTKSSLIIGTMYEKQEIYSISDMLYQYNQETFDSYDYVLIDYPPTINELSLNFLILSDLVIIPINDALRAFKGILDLKDNINKICKQENRKTPNMKIVFNNVKESFNFVTIEKWIQDEKLENLVIKSKIKYSDAFKTIENELSSIWTNPYYWRQKQAYEELIKEMG
ncbi:ParA family protein, partial [Spiroplasma endosymbiont of Lariophagus distinguendus]|uniref:ParA family protein n=1 Tax=Spiroplasma endosymbiont of Lariophagus distinguendus TaxID=2935082 RepID=UPI00207A9D72